MKRWRVSDITARHEAMDWVLEHGLNPDLIPLEGMVDILDDDHIEVQVYQRDGAGHLLKDNEPVTSWHQVHPVRRPIPEHLLEDE